MFSILQIRKQCIGLPLDRKYRKCKKHNEERGWNRILVSARATIPRIHGRSWDKGIAGLLGYVDVHMCLGGLKSRGSTGNLEGLAKAIQANIF